MCFKDGGKDPSRDWRRVEEELLGQLQMQNRPGKGLQPWASCLGTGAQLL